MPGEAPRSQTLSRGIDLLERLAADGPLTIAELSARSGLHRSVAYRLLRTLEDHRLVSRTGTGAYGLGTGISILSRAVVGGLQRAIGSELVLVADELQMTTFVAVLDEGAVITIASAEPSGPHAAVIQRPGARHELAAGAPGLAIQSTLDASRLVELLGEQPVRDLELVRSRGYATSEGEVIEGLSSVAVPLRVRDQPAAAVAVVYLSRRLDVEPIARRLAAAAEAITARGG